MRLIAALAVTLALLAGLAAWLVRPDAPRSNALSLAAALAADTSGFARATAPRPFRFPDDHGPHPDFRTEWWYYTGNLDGPDGQAFGYELTIFRIALTPPGSPDADTADADTAGWRTRQMYMAHFGLTDAKRGTFRAFERFSRGAAGLAGAQGAPFRVWLEGWEASEAAGGMPAMRLRANEGGYGIDLTLRPEKPVVLQGDRGLSQKGPGVGNASYYYSYTRIVTEGTVTTPSGRVPVRGSSWMDREWSTSALGRDQVGWDWFALQLSDGRELMVYQLREKDGRPSRYSSGTLVERDGRTRPLPGFTLTPTATWTSPHSGAEYPSAWTLDVPSENLQLRVEPVLNDQELNVSVRYWEGAVRVAGARGLTGRGYVELTGYGDIETETRGTRSAR